MAGVAGAVATVSSPSLRAQGRKPLRILVGYPPGGSADTGARLLASRLKDFLGGTVIVENRPGAGGQIAAQALKTAPADGSTVLLSSDHTISILPLVNRNPGFNPSVDFVHVAGFASFVHCFAASMGTPATTFQQYVEWARGAGKGNGSVGVPAPDSAAEFLVSVISEQFHLDLVSASYRGAGPLMSDMLGNQISAGVAAVPDFMENHRGQRLRILGVLGPCRLPLLPDVPTFSEVGLDGFEDTAYVGFFAPRGTPDTAVAPIAEGIKQALAQDFVRDNLVSMGLTPEFMPQRQFAEREQAYTQAWSRIIAGRRSR